MSRERKPPKMIGPFAQVAEDFIQYKRSCGFKYENEPKCLSRFCRFAKEQGVTSVEITRELAEAWISPKDGVSDKTRAHNITCIRQFAIYLDSIGFDAYILPEQHGLYANSFVPYIFTHEQIRSIIKEADATKPQEVAKNMHLALPVIFRILYCCGLRVSEVCNLRFCDVNLDAGILTLHDPKNGRDRYIPLSDSVRKACESYAEHIWWEKDTDYFFMAPDRTKVSPMTIYQRYRRYLAGAGISHGGKEQGPRLHDLRHTFAVHVLQKWITEGADLTAMMPILSTYMGHMGIRSTAQYLRLTAEVYPDLMKQVEKTCSYVIPEVTHEGD